VARTLAVAILVFLIPVSMMMPQTFVKEETAKIYGPGNSSCGEWTATRGADSKRPSTGWVQHMMMLVWVEGFLSGSGAMKSGQKETDSSAIELWVDQYCSAHPLETVHETTVHLVISLGGGRKEIRYLSPLDRQSERPVLTVETSHYIHPPRPGTLLVY
jgi:hypothetical protein